MTLSSFRKQIWYPSEQTGAGYIFMLGLLPFSLTWNGVSRVRNLLYDNALLHISQLPAPVVSIGNITAGGTGKTPLVETIARKLEGKGWKVAILSRGYGPRETEGTGDDESLPGRLRRKNIRRFTGPNRYKTGQKAMKSFEPDLFVLDDGFQHRQLDRDLDVVLVNALEGLGNGFTLPAGPLREPPGSLRRCDVLIFSHTNRLEKTRLNEREDQVQSYLHPRTPILHGRHALRSYSLYEGKNASENRTDPLPAERVVAFCGLGYPEQFRAMLEESELDLLTFRAFPDHHRYTEGELTELEEQVRTTSADLLVTTEKDQRKLPYTPSVPLLIPEVAFELTRGADTLWEQLDPLLTEKEK